MPERMSREPVPATVTRDAAAAGETGGLLWKKGLWIPLLRLGVVAGFLLLWEIASGRWIEPFLISSPTRIVASMIASFQSGDLLQHTWVTFEEIAIGFPLGAISGIALGYCFGR